MEFPMNFISRSTDYCSFDRDVSAPYLRKRFEIDKKVKDASIIICGLGFYELFVNGERLTKGALAPYISTPDDIIYYDKYDIDKHLKVGENIIGLILGNGMQNAFGAIPWKFDKAKWRGAPKVALRVNVEYESGESFEFESDSSFKTSDSPIYFDDLRAGESYDARKEQKGWNDIGFDDSDWTSAIIAPIPRGEPIFCKAEPIVVTHELKPISINKQQGGYLYDFGANCAGVCRLTIKGSEGQQITLEHGEWLQDGNINFSNIKMKTITYMQKDIYICSGESIETYTPTFTYHGFQYVLVTGITDQQATVDLLTYLVMNSDLKEIGNFECSNETINTLQKLTRRSTLANFYYIPTDCPHREKNAWTGDAALSAEHTLINLSAEESYKEWLRNIRKAQNEPGTIPAIIPTGGAGFDWGNGPAWDCVLTYLPYFIYQYRGDIEVLKDNATAIFKYLNFLSNNISSDGLIRLGLGDWCTPNRPADKYKSPLEFTDTVTCIDICDKAASIFEVLEMDLHKDFAIGLSNKLRKNVRERLIDFGTMTAIGNCQTSQAMAIFYNVFDNGEKPVAMLRLLEMIEQAGGHMDTGILGARVVFHVLSAFGHSDLAFNMIVTPEFPSYGNWIQRGATSLWETFMPEGQRVASLNHHFFGDISSWFIKCIAGIKINPYFKNPNEVNITPSFINTLDYAKAYHITPQGKIAVEWKRYDSLIELTIQVSENINGKIILENNWVFEDGISVKELAEGKYIVHRLLNGVDTRINV